MLFNMTNSTKIRQILSTCLGFNLRLTILMVKLNIGSICIITEAQCAIQSQIMLQSNCTERLHVDETIMRYFQTELCSSVLPSTNAGHANLAAAKQ